MRSVLLGSASFVSVLCCQSWHITDEGVRVDSRSHDLFEI